MSMTAKQFEAALDQIPKRTGDLLLRYMKFAQMRLGQTSINSYMRDAGKGAGPRDPSDTGPLRIVSSRLSRSLVAGQFAFGAGTGGPEGISDIKATESGVKLTYGSKVPYALAHEEGFTGVVNVPAHSRTITQAFGRKIAPRTVFVDAYSYNQNIPARPYLQPSLEDNMDELTEELADRFLNMVLEVLE